MKKVVVSLLGSLLVLVPGIPFYKGIASEKADSFSNNLADKFFGAGEKVSKALKGILQVCDSGFKGGALKV